jgi:hypothetical protein
VIVSELAFYWFTTVALALSGAGWLVIDLVRLRRALRAEPRDPDYLFGCLIGLAIIIVGLVGVARRHFG